MCGRVCERARVCVRLGVCRPLFHFVPRRTDIAVPARRGQRASAARGETESESESEIEKGRERGRGRGVGGRGRERERVGGTGPVEAPSPGGQDIATQPLSSQDGTDVALAQQSRNGAGNMTPRPRRVGSTAMADASLAAAGLRRVATRCAMLQHVAGCCARPHMGAAALLPPPSPRGPPRAVVCWAQPHSNRCAQRQQRPDEARACPVATSAPGPGSSLTLCAETGLTPATSAPRPGALVRRVWRRGGRRCPSRLRTDGGTGNQTSTAPHARVTVRIIE